VLPFETERIMLNERLLPGITKVSKMAELFPQIDQDPKTPYLREEVLVYRGPMSDSAFLMLLQESRYATVDDFHQLRMEFVKRVFYGYVVDSEGITESAKIVI
jgi:hypothetical protein